MLHRVISVSVLTVAVSATLLGAMSSAAPRQGASRSVTSSPKSTVVEHVRPVTATGALRHGYTIAHRRANASCSFGSEATGDAYRCFSGNEVLDPCWVMSQKHFVACLPDAWSHKVVRLHVTKGYENDGFTTKHASYPWGLQQLKNGVRCSWLQGASGEVKGKRISYGCTKTTYLIGNVNKKPALWRIDTAKSTSGGHFKETGVVQLKKAWFGKPTLKGS